LPVLEHLRRSGASRQDFARADRELQMRIPDDLRTWWTWRTPIDQVEIMSLATMVSLETAVGW
jgi:hypothetical protein